MSEEIESVPAPQQEGKISFLTGKQHDLQKSLDALRRANPAAIKALVILATSSEDEKIKLAAATSLIDLSTKMSKEISRENLTRLIGEVRLNGGMAKGSEMRTIDGEEEDAVVDFSSIPSEYQD